jgi:hypothetical protein
MHGHAKRVLLLLCVALAFSFVTSTGLAQIRNVPNTTQAVPMPLKALRVSAVEGQFIYGGTPVRGTVELNQPPGPNGVRVTLESSNPQLAGVPSGVTVTGGVSSAETGPLYTATFPINTRPVQADTTVIIRARVGAQALQTNLRIVRPGVKSASLDPPKICNGDNRGTVRYFLTGPAPPGFTVNASANVTVEGGGGSVGSTSESDTVPSGNTSGSLRIRLPPCQAHNPGQLCSITGFVNPTPLGTSTTHFGGHCGHPPD